MKLEPCLCSEQFVVGRIDIVKYAKFLRGKIVPGHVGAGLILVTAQSQFSAGDDPLPKEPSLKFACRAVKPDLFTSVSDGGIGP